MEKALQTEVEALIAGAVKSAAESLEGKLTEAIKPIGALVTRVGELGKNVKVVADTIAALPPAGAGKEGAKEKKDEGAKTLTEADIDARVEARVQKLLGDKSTSDQASARKLEARKKVIAAQLPGVDEALIHLPDTDDEAALTAAATALRGKIETSFKTKLANVGGAGNDGGTGAGGQQQPPKYTTANTNLSPAAAADASALKLPK